MIRRRQLLLIPASLIVLAACTWYWLLHTESGAQWIWARAQSATGGALQAQSLRGDLGSGLTMRQFAFATSSRTFEFEEIKLSADLDILPLQIQISDVSIHNAKVRNVTPEQVAEKKDFRNTIEKLSLPLPLVFADVSADKVTLSEIIPRTHIVLTQVTLAGSWHDKIIIEHLIADSLDSSVDLSAELELTRPFAVSVSGQITNADVLTVFAEPIDIQLRGEGNLEELSIEMSSVPIAMSLQGSVSNILDSMIWSLQATLAEITLELGENNTEVFIADGRASVSGSLQEYLLTAAATVDLPDFEPLQVTTSGKGTWTSFDFSDLGLHNADADLSGDGRIVWGENWSIESGLSVAAFNLHALIEKWPVDHSIHGDLSLQLNRNHLAIRDSRLTAGNTGMSVQADGKVDFLEAVVDGNLRWENVLWPLAGDQASVSSKSGDITVDGSLDDWRIDGKVEVATAAMPSGQFFISGSGDRHHVETTIIDSAVLSGKVSGYATFNWRDQQAWSAGLDTSGISLSSFGDDWPDDVTGRVDAEGRFSPFLLDLQLSNIVASFPGGPLSANGQVTLSDDHFMASDLKILHGETHIDLHGDPFARSGLSFDIAVDDASQYIDAASGAFAMAGRVSLHPEQLALRIDATSKLSPDRANGSPCRSICVSPCRILRSEAMK